MKIVYWNIDSVSEFVKLNSECSLISTEYKSTKNKLQFRCRCGDIFEVTFEKFKNNNKRQCNKCSGITNWNIKTAKEFIEGNDGNGCVLLSDFYKNMYTVLSIQCACKNVFQTPFTSFVHANQRQCPDCGIESSINSRRLLHENVQKIIENQSSCRLVSKKYTNNSTPLDVGCSCGNIFQVTLANFEHGCQRQCGYCSGNISWNYSSIRQFVEEESSCTLISDKFYTIDTKMEFECSCGNRFETTFATFRKSKRQCYNCSCSMSKSEVAISKYLTDSDIDFVSEYTFSDCIGDVRPLRFDFAILDSLNSVRLIIESDGEGHYRPVNFGGCSDEDAIRTFNNTVRYDKVKNAYCKENNIDLIRIPYWEFDNIDNYLKDAMP